MEGKQHLKSQQSHQKTEGPRDRRTKAPEDQRTRGPRDQRPEDQGTRGPRERTEGPGDSKTTRFENGIKGPKGQNTESAQET